MSDREGLEKLAAAEVKAQELYEDCNRHMRKWQDDRETIMRLVPGYEYKNRVDDPEWEKALDRLRALLAAGPDREAIAQILVEEYPACIKRPSDAYRGADRILDATGTEETKAKKGELREEVGKLLLNISNCYIEWGTRDEDEKEMWREDADRVIAFLCPAPAANTEGLREALETVGDYIRDIGHGKNCDVLTTYGEMGCSCGYRERVFEQIDAALRGEGTPKEVKHE